MIQVGTVRWRCEPTIAAVQVMAEAWIVLPPIIAKDLAPESEFHKVIRITTGHDREEKHLLCVQCTTNTRGETRVDFLLYGNLDASEIQEAEDFVERIKKRGESEGLTPRRVGFGV